MSYYNHYITIIEFPGTILEATQFERNTISGIELYLSRNRTSKLEIDYLSNHIKSKRPFIIILSDSGTEMDDSSYDQLKNLISIAVMSNSYFKLGKQIPIGLLNINTTRNTIISRITEDLESQGLKFVKIHPFFSNNKVSNFSFGISDTILLTNEDQVLQFDVTNSSKILQLLNRFVYFKSNSFENSYKLSTLFTEKVKTYLKDSDLDLFLKRLKEDNQKLLQQEEIITKQAEEIAIANTFVEVAKNKYKNDYLSLFEFYQKEYEALPLWYKRFGHIIKVLTGKRTIRSLFKDE